MDDREAGRLGFADYGTLELRRHFCEGRTLPQLPARASSTCGHADHMAVAGARAGRAGKGEEYAVEMFALSGGALFSELLQAGTLAPEDVDRLAGLVAGPPRALAARRLQAMASGESNTDAAPRSRPRRLHVHAPRTVSTREWSVAGNERRRPCALWDARRDGGRSARRPWGSAPGQCGPVGWRRRSLRLHRIRSALRWTTCWTTSLSRSWISARAGTATSQFA